jgi:glycosyltransferase involved in cell wall biosynthesis
MPNFDPHAVRVEYGIDPKRSVILYIGRHDREKRLDLLLSAAHRLQRDDYQLVFIGTGAFAQALHHQSHHFKLGKKAVFLGFIPSEKLVPVINCADIFVMPSPEELQSIASLEAMACAKPIIAANARALPELVHDSVNGALFKPNDVEDLARQINRLLDQRQDWLRMGAVSRELALTHDIHNTVRRYFRLYEEVISQKRKQVKQLGEA